MGQFLVVVETVVLCAHTKVHVPFHTGFLPLFEPVKLCSGLDEELHFHLLEFPHAEYELAGHNLIPEGLTYLCDAKRNLHPAGLLHVQVVHENALGGLRAQIDGICTVGRGTH